MSKKQPDPRTPGNQPEGKAERLVFFSWAGSAKSGEGAAIQPPTVSTRRLNRKSAIILLIAATTIAALYLPVKLLQEGALRRSALAQARKAFDDGRVDQAFLNVDAYLETWPDDYDGLRLKGELVSKSAASPEQLAQGAQAIDNLLRLDPGPPERQDDRKRLIELSIRLGDMIRAGADRAKVGNDKFESRYRFANKLAEQRITLGANDGESHRLLATTQDRLSTMGDEQAGLEAIKEYQRAIRYDAGDFVSAERLAALRIEKRKDQAGADQILDNLVKARPRLVDARLARARHFLKTGREDRAKVDVEAAARMDATNRGVRLMAASLALRRGDATSARRHLAAIPSTDGDSRLDVLLAQLEFVEKRPDKAIAKFREGLVRSSGTDRELNWRLAYSLIQLGRPAEARPVMAQFRRLVGRADHPMLRLLEGLIREKSGRHAAAIVELEPARDEIDAEWRGELDMILGRCHEAVGDLEAARTDYLRARDLSPSAASPRQALARLLLQTEPDRAVAELEEGLRFSQGTPQLFADLAQAQVARQLAKPLAARDWSAAESAIDRGLRIKADDPSLIRARIVLLVATGRAEQVASMLDDATKGVARGQEEVWLARARWLESRGRATESLKVLEQASKPESSGDSAALRAARASLLVRNGHGRDALKLVALDIEKFTIPERAMLARAKADLLFSLGDRQGARLALVEWAELAPEEPGPGLSLVEMARKGGTPEELEQGVEMLRKVGGDDEPSALAAQALGILLPDSDEEQADATKLDQAETISQRLQEVAPNLPVTSLIRAMLHERSSGFEEAIADYKVAMKGDTTGLALPRLVALLTKLEKKDDLALLKAKTTAGPAIDRILLKGALDSGDNEKSEALLAKLVEAQPDSLEYRADLARVLRDLGKPEQAEATLRDLVDRHPERPQPWLALLALQLDRGDKEAAKATVEKLKGGYKGDRPDLVRARCLWAIGDREKAAKASETALAARPDDLEMIRLSSEMEEANGRSDRAELLLARARKLDPNAPWARRRLALILAGRLNHSRWLEARAMMDPSTSGSADSPEDRMTRAMVLERGPDPSHRAEAVAVLRSLADDLPASHPIATKVRIGLARSLLAANDPAGASKAIAPTTTESASPDPATLTLAVESLALEGQAEEARKLFERLVKVQPDAPSTFACRALVLKAEGDLEGAVSVLSDAASAAEKIPDGERLNRFYFEQLVRLGPDTAAETLGRKVAGLWPAQSASLARFFATRGRVDEALDACRVAVQAGQARESLRLILSLDAPGRLDEASSEKARTIAISAAAGAPRDADVLAMTASLLRRHRRFEDEADLYRKILAAEPTNVVARNNLAWVLGLDLGKPAEGLIEVDRVIRQIGPSPQAGDTRGMILAKLGRLDEAIADLEQAAKVDPSAIHHIHLARAYAQAGRQADRKRTLEAARLAAANLNALEPDDRAELDARDLH